MAATFSQWRSFLHHLEVKYFLSRQELLVVRHIVTLLYGLGTSVICHVFVIWNVTSVVLISVELNL